MPDISSRSREIVRCLLGDPNQKLSTHDEWRYGTNGSLAIEVGGAKAGQWYDHENQRGGGILDLLWIYGDMRDDDAWEWLEREIGIRRNKPGSERNKDGGHEKQQKIATYTYVDERGKTLFWVYRWGPKKTFTQAQPGPDRGGIKRKPSGGPSMEGARYVPYHLDQLAAAMGSGKPWRVFIVEGEKDADRLIRQWGVLATTNAGGAGKWRKEYARHFIGAEVIVIADNDTAGKDHAAKVGEALAPVAFSVRVVEISGAGKTDISDWIDAGGSQSDFEDLLDGVEPLPKPPPPGADEVFMRDMADIKMRPIDWLWPNRIARGKLSLIAGHPGLGKSQVALWIAAIVSSGGFWPGAGRAQVGRVLILSAEDDPEDTIKPRLVAAGCDESRVHIIEAVRTLDEDGQPVERGFSIIEDVGRLGAVLEKFSDVAVVIIDPITAYLGEDIDSHQTVAVRAVLRPLQEIAAKHRVALIGVTHLRKNTEGDAVLLVTGSLAFVAAARATYFVMRDEANPQRRLFLTAKNNLGIDTTGYAYSLKTVELPEGITTSTVEWEGGTLETTADDEIARRRTNKTAPARETEQKFLKELLAAGPLAVQEIQTTAKAAGLSWRTVQRAMKDLGVLTVKTGGSGEGWEWQLP